MKNTIILLLVVAICAISNPNREAHVDALKRDFLNERERGKSQSAIDAIGQGIAHALGGSMIEALLQIAEYRNWVLGSALVLERRGDNRLISVGALGQVWVIIDKEDK